MKKIIILTGNELRHDFVRKFIAGFDVAEVIKTFCECNDSNLTAQVNGQEDNTLRKKHLAIREQTEKDFFELFCGYTPDKSNPVFIKKGDINSAENVQLISDLNPDIIVAYGCSIIKPALIQLFHKRFINVHLGLSPYYRGSGTNYWPFVNNEIEYVGVTFMYMDEGVDTGEIFHQLKPRIYYNDTIHTIGNRLIYDMAKTLAQIIEQFDLLKSMQPATADNLNGKYYRQKDFTEASLQLMYQNFSAGLIEHYLANKEQLDLKVKIISNPALM